LYHCLQRIEFDYDETFKEADTFAFLFCVGKPPAKHKGRGPCYPRGMEILLAVTLTAIMIVLIVDTKEKRHAFLCQREDIIKKR